jgi:hypothetical protein
MARIRFCPSGKFGYVERRDAASELASFRANPKHKKGHPPERLYRCHECGLYHLTSKKKRRRA